MANESMSGFDERKMPHIREAIDAESHQGLKADPTDHDAKLDVALDESFPTSDASSHTRPGSSEPPLSSGYDAAAERRLARTTAWQAMTRQWAVPALLGTSLVAGAAIMIALRRRGD
jgi:hypothetical protein